MVSPTLLLASLLGFAFLSGLIGIRFKKGVAYILPIVFAVTLGLLIYMSRGVLDGGFLQGFTGGEKPPYSINLVLTPFSLLILFLVHTLSFLLSIHLLIRGVPEPTTKFVPLFILNILGVTGIILTGDLFNLFVFLEILSISSVSLIGFMRDGKGLEGGLKYLIVGGVGSSLYLLAVIILYKYTGTLNMADVGMRIGEVPEGMRQFVMLLIIAGLGVEAEIFPFNMWVPDAYQGADTKVTTLLASITSKAGMFGLVRVLFTVLGAGMNILLYLGIITFVISELMALKTKNIKRVLAYSSMGQAGLAMIAFGINTAASIAAGMLLMINHAVSKFVMFGSIEVLTDRFRLDDIKGIGLKFPVPAWSFLLATLSLLGFPFFIGFWVKLNLIFSLKPYLLVPVLLIFAVEIAYYTRILWTMFSGEAKMGKTLAGSSAVLLIGVVIVIALAFVYPYILNLSVKGTSELLFRGLYIYRVLGGGL